MRWPDLRCAPLRSSAETLATARAAAGQNEAAADGLGAGAEAVATLAHELGRLVSPFHGQSRSRGPLDLGVRICRQIQDAGADRWRALQASRGSIDFMRRLPLATASSTHHRVRMTDVPVAGLYGSVAPKSTLWRRFGASCGPCAGGALIHLATGPGEDPARTGPCLITSLSSARRTGGPRAPGDRHPTRSADRISALMPFIRLTSSRQPPNRRPRCPGGGIGRRTSFRC